LSLFSLIFNLHFAHLHQLCDRRTGEQSLQKHQVRFIGSRFPIQV
jgi:hypothetical protein